MLYHRNEDPFVAVPQTFSLLELVNLRITASRNLDQLYYNASIRPATAQTN